MAGISAAAAVAMKHRKRAAWLAMTCAAVMLASVPGGGVDDDSVFELDGNVVDSTPTPTGIDWTTVVAAGPTSTSTGLVTDSQQPNGQGDTILTGGGTKDIYDFSKWLWKQTATTSVQDKDDIIHAAATAITLPNGHTGIYFMADRFDNSGDSQMGFWFVQDSNVGTNNNAQGGASGGFNGHHVDGDILIVAHFVTGGSAPEIEVFQWSGGVNGTINTIVSSNARKCDSSSGSQTLCAIVNANDGETALQPFLNKSGQTTYGHGEIMEGGIDLQAIFGDNTPCISTFFAETRSSQSPTSTLSDFTAPVPFPLCHMSITKNCTGAAVNADGSTVHYGFNGTLTNDGQGSLFSIAITDVPPSNVIANSLLFTKDALPDVCVINGQNVPCLKKTHSIGYSGSYNTNSVGGKNHVDAVAGSSPGGNSVTASADWPLDAQGQPLCKPTITKGLTLTKSCTASLAPNGSSIKVHIGVTGNVCNTGNIDLTGVTVTDSVIGTILGPLSLEPGACQNYPISTGYDPTSVPNACTFTDTASATANVPASLGGGTVTATPVTATCVLCSTN
jgi:hypothetical protein